MHAIDITRYLPESDLAELCEAYFNDEPVAEIGLSFEYAVSVTLNTYLADIILIDLHRLIMGPRNHSVLIPISCLWDFGIEENGQRFAIRNLLHNHSFYEIRVP